VRAPGCRTQATLCPNAPTSLPDDQAHRRQAALPSAHATVEWPSRPEGGCGHGARSLGQLQRPCRLAVCAASPTTSSDGVPCSVRSLRRTPHRGPTVRTRSCRSPPGWSARCRPTLSGPARGGMGQSLRTSTRTLAPFRPSRCSPVRRGRCTQTIAGRTDNRENRTLGLHVRWPLKKSTAKPIHASSCRLLESLPRQVVVGGCRLSGRPRTTGQPVLNGHRPTIRPIIAETAGEVSISRGRLFSLALTYPLGLWTLRTEQVDRDSGSR